MIQGYTYSVFNLVYETNVASCRIWDALGFKRIGRIKSCGNLRSSPDELVDAIIYGRDLGPEGEDFVSEERFDKIRYYLKHGTYPSGADRAEKSRLRSAATHYKLILPDESGQGEKLMLKDKEVVSDPQRQYEIARVVHASQHGGINKTTATIAEKFHWVRIKETVSLVIKNCPDCKDSAAKAPIVRPLSESNGSTTAPQLRRTNAANNSGQNVDPNSMIERLVNFDQMEQQQPNHTSTPSRTSDIAPPSSVSVANMHALQQYNDIPLDPQIMGHQHPPPPHPLPSHLQNNQYTFQQNPQHHRQSPIPYSRPTSNNSTPHYHPLATPPNGTTHSPQPTNNVDMTTEPQLQSQHQHHQHDTRMATERHVRQGDEPMAYQDGRGVVHGGASTSGGTGTETGTPKVIDGAGGGDSGDPMDLEELLGRQ